MKTKILKKIRKYWDYRFCEGTLFMRRKADGHIREFKSVERFVTHYIYENMGMMTGMRWDEYKQSIRDKKLWAKVSNCN